MTSVPETFFQRWTRRKTEQRALESAPLPPDSVQVASQAAIPAAPAPVPTLADVTDLLADADYSRFIAPDVDRVVHRAAMKKLFAEPGFSVMDELDIYIADYNIASPVSAVMLAGFAHANTTLNPTAAWQSGTDLTPVATAPAEEVVAIAEAADADAMPSDGMLDRASDNDLSAAEVAVAAGVAKPGDAVVCLDVSRESASDKSDRLP